MKAKVQDKGKAKENFDRPLMKNKEKGDNKEFTRRESPEVKAIISKINAASADVEKQKESLVKQKEKIFEIRRTFEYAIKDAKSNKTSLESISADIERMKKELNKLADDTEFEKKKAAAIAKLNAKKEEMLNYLPKFHFSRDTKDPEEIAMDYLDALDKEKAKYETTDYEDEKQERLNARKILEINAKRGLAIEYIDLFKEMRASFRNPAAYEQEFLEFKIALAYENMDRLMDKQKAYLYKAGENSKFAKEALEKLEQDKATLAAKVKEVQDLRLQLDKQRYLERQKRIEEMKKREAEELERQKKFEEEKKMFDSKKPYEDEIEKCNALLNYLSQYALPKEGEQKETAPKKEEEEAKPAAATEPAAQKKSAVAEATIKVEKMPFVEVNKKKRTAKAKKPVDKSKQTINHNMEIFSKFADIGVTCPLVRGEVNDTIEQVRAQKALFQKKSEEEIKQREEKAAAAAAAAAEKKEEEPKTEENKEATA